MDYNHCPLCARNGKAAILELSPDKDKRPVVECTTCGALFTDTKSLAFQQQLVQGELNSRRKK